MRKEAVRVERGESRGDERRERSSFLVSSLAELLCLLLRSVVANSAGFCGLVACVELRDHARKYIRNFLVLFLHVDYKKGQPLF